MRTASRLIVAAALSLVVLPGLAQAAKCKPQEVWKHEHKGASSDVQTHDIKGSRATRIEVCRAEDPSGQQLVVEVQYEGTHDSRPLASGDCVGKYAKWAIIKSKGAQASDGVPSTASGTYTVCRD